MKTTRRWLPLLLLPLLGVALTIVAHRFGWEALIAKSTHEVLAVPLVASCTVLWTWAAWSLRDRTMGVVAALVAVFTCREIHFDGSDHLLYPALLAFICWVWLRRSTLRPLLREQREFQWFTAGLWAYVVSQVVARRAFRGVPGEHELHVEIEELVETVGHLLLLRSAALAASRAWVEPSSGSPGHRTPE